MGHLSFVLDVDAQNKVRLLTLLKNPSQYFDICIHFFFTTLHGIESRSIHISVKYVKEKTKDVVSGWTCFVAG